MVLNVSLPDLTKEELIELVKELDKKNDELERELKKYKNPNTPSSAHKHIKPDTFGLKAKTGAKRGAPVGHKGATSILSSPEEIIPVSTTACCHCHSHNVEPTGYVKPKPVFCLIKPKVVLKLYQQHEVRCRDCHKLTLATHQDIPQLGIYDKTIQSLVNYFKFKARLPHNLIVDCMNTVFEVPMTDATSLEITRRASKKLEPLYIEIEEMAKLQNVINADETSQSVNGITNWVWIFCNHLFSLFKINKERGGDIVERVLGKEFKGKVVSDGWKTYSVYCKDNKIVHGRCWSHGLREVEFECKRKHPDLYKWFCDIFEMTKKGKAEPDEKKRHEWFEKCKSELEMWITHAEAHQNLRKFAAKMKNGEEDWFTAILYPEMPLDNNEAERSLRPWVIIRKIIGCLRSEIGKRNYEVMISLISTWQKQQKNTFSMLQATL